MNHLLGDIKYGLRTLRKNPAVTLVAVLTLALGIGANTAIFTVVNGVVLRPLPYPDADRLVSLCEEHPSVAGYCVASPPNVEDWSSETEKIEDMGLGRGWAFILMGEEGSQSLRGGIATAGLFRVLKIRPHLGRLFEDSDSNHQGNGVALISYGLWNSRFGGDPEVLGQQVQLDDGTFTIVGVLPESAEVPHLAGIDLWTPLPFDPHDEENRGWRGFRAFGRLTSGTSIAEAQKEMDLLATRTAEEYPETSDGWSLSVQSLHEQIVGSVRPLLLILLGAVSFVLLIGCANVANLLVARASERRREFAVRAAIGAGRGRLFRLLLTESLLLSVLGGAAGLLLASWATEIFLSLAPSGIPRLGEVSLDGRVLGFTVGLSVVTSVLFGLFPSFHAASVDLNQSLKEGEQLAFGSSRLGVRGILVASETALALVLLIGASLLIQSFLVLTRWEPGFERENLLTSWLLASSAKYETADQAEVLFQQAIDEVRSLPAVESVGATSAGPLFGGTETDELIIEGRPVPPAGERPVARWYDVSPNYFRTLGLPLLRGRDFARSDTKSSNPVAIINETMARRHWDDRNPIGDRVQVRERTLTIVGVVGDVQPFRPGDAIQPEIFWPKQQAPRYATYLVIRTDGETAGVTRSIEDRLKQLDPDMSVSRMTTMVELMGRRLVSPRFHMLLMGSFGFVALVLAIMGTYGVIAYSVSRQTRELGIRLALGARTADIVRSVVQRGMVPTLLGVLIGLTGAFFLTRFLSSYIFGVRPTDLPTYLGVALILSVVALLACYIPARRATRISTMDSLRYE